MFGMGMPEILLILAIALIVIGPKKLPDLAKSLGRALGEFKKATTDLKESMEIDNELSDVKKAFDGLNADANADAASTDEPVDKARVASDVDSGDTLGLDGLNADEGEKDKPSTQTAQTDANADAASTDEPVDKARVASDVDSGDTLGLNGLNTNEDEKDKPWVKTNASEDAQAADDSKDTTQAAAGAETDSVASLERENPSDESAPDDESLAAPSSEPDASKKSAHVSHVKETDQQENNTTSSAKTKDL